MRYKWQLALLLAVSILVHFAYFSRPREVVFDEVHFGKFISGYSTHEYYFDIHPPLGKLIIAGFGKLFHFKPEFSFAEIGNAFPDSKYQALRFLPSLAGALLPIVIYLLALELGLTPLGALIAGGLVVFDNALVAQSRFILLDAFLLLFGFSGLWCYFRYRNTHRWPYLIGCGVGAALGMSIKWTGGAFLALPIILEIFELGRTRKIAHLWQKIVMFLVVPPLLYMAVFAVHFKLLYKSGTGDAFMSQAFQSTLQGSHVESDDPAPSFLEKFLELNLEMYRSNQRLTADHPYSSRWYTWPFMQRPIFYWVHDQARIYLLGNPVVWWLSTVAVVYGLGLTVSSLWDKRSQSPLNPKLVAILLTGYVLNLLPFIGIKRVMFLYHYFTALIFAVLLLAYLIDQSAHRKKYAAIILATTAVLFLFFSPLTYGLPMANPAYHLRLWLPTWQ